MEQKECQEEAKKPGSSTSRFPKPRVERFNGSLTQAPPGESNSLRAVSREISAQDLGNREMDEHSHHSPHNHYTKGATPGVVVWRLGETSKSSYIYL